MTLKTKVKMGLKWQAISMAGRQLISFVVFTSLARILEPSDFGLVGLTGVYIFLVGLLAEQGIGLAIVQRADLENLHLHTAFWFNLGVAVVVFAVTASLAYPIATAMGEPRIAPLLRWSALNIVIYAFAAVHDSIFLREMDFRTPVFRLLLGNICGGVVGIWMALKGCGAWSLVGQQLTATAAGCAFVWSASSYRPCFKFSWSHLRDLIGVSASVLMNDVLSFASSRLDQLAIARLDGPHGLGIYMIAGKLPELLRIMVNQPVSVIILPVMSSVQTDHSKLRSIICRGLELTATVSFAVLVGVASVTHEVIPIVFGLRWQSAASPCSLLCIYILILSLSAYIHPAMIATGGARKYLRISCLNTAAVVISCVLGAYTNMTTLITMLIFTSLGVLCMGLRELRFRIDLLPSDYLRPCVVPALAAGFMMLAVVLVSIALPAVIPMVWQLVLKICVGATVYVGALWIGGSSFIARMQSSQWGWGGMLKSFI